MKPGDLVRTSLVDMKWGTAIWSCYDMNVRAGALHGSDVAVVISDRSTYALVLASNGLFGWIYSDLVREC